MQRCMAGMGKALATDKKNKSMWQRFQLVGGNPDGRASVVRDSWVDSRWEVPRCPNGSQFGAPFCFFHPQSHFALVPLEHQQFACQRSSISPQEQSSSLIELV